MRLEARQAIEQEQLLVRVQRSFYNRPRGCYYDRLPLNEHVCTSLWPLGVLQSAVIKAFRVAPER